MADHCTQVSGLGTQVDSSPKFGDSRLDSDSEAKYLRLDLDSGENDFKLASTCDIVTWMTHIALPFVTVWFFSCGFHFVWARVSHLCQSELRADSSTDKQQLPFNFSQAVSRLVRDLTLQFVTRFDLIKPMTRLDMTWHNVVTWLDLTCQQKRRLGTCLRLGTNWLETYLGLGSEGLEQWSDK